VATSNRPALLILGIIIALAAGLRLWAAVGDLWIDEIWSLDNIALARASTRPGDWLALFFHDNTHALNTAYLAIMETLIGPYGPSWAYRALSIASGIAAVGVAAAIGWRRSPWEALIAGALVGFSYPMIHYSSEARGYMPMLLAGLAAYAILERHLETPTQGRMAAFIVVCLLGLAAHLTFVVVLGGFGLWAAVVLFQRPEPTIRTIARLCILFGAQITAVTFYGAIAVNNMVFGGGAMVPAIDALGDMAEFTFGVDPAGRGSVTLTIALGVGWVVWWLHRRGKPEWIFFAVVVLAGPLGVVIADLSAGLAPRYFIASALFALIATARGIAVLLAGGHWSRIFGGVILAVILVGNGLLADKFFNTGRGHYADAVAAIAGAGTPPVRYAGYHPFSIEKVTAYHARRIGRTRDIQFANAGEDARNPAGLYIDGNFNGTAPPGEISRAVNGGLIPYRLLAAYPHWGLSGDTWAIYRRAN
jgi:hypothetical protein